MRLRFCDFIFFKKVIHSIKFRDPVFVQQKIIFKEKFVITLIDKISTYRVTESKVHSDYWNDLKRWL